MNNLQYKFCKHTRLESKENIGFATFANWLTDLAGAEPTPLGGCEKFVVKFPLPVLNSFLRSFSYVEWLSESLRINLNYLLTKSGCTFGN